MREGWRSRRSFGSEDGGAWISETSAGGVSLLERERSSRLCRTVQPSAPRPAEACRLFMRAEELPAAVGVAAVDDWRLPRSGESREGARARRARGRARVMASEYSEYLPQAVISNQ